MLTVLRSIPVSALRRRQQKPLHPSPLVSCAILDLPPEILREIFLHCIPPGEWGSFSAYDAPWLLLKVCRSWRGVAFSTPKLWSVLPFLRMYPPQPGGRPQLGDGHRQLLKLYLKYSAGATLSIRLELLQRYNNVLTLPSS
ncbi:hypothetical protein BD779DRAFT_460068 [Infundibulicybe gibba]|nr:hypothetical protein BD779DRAFT_460068 [Infundibulicybe gibba]